MLTYFHADDTYFKLIKQFNEREKQTTIKKSVVKYAITRINFKYSYYHNLNQFRNCNI